MNCPTEECLFVFLTTHRDSCPYCGYQLESRDRDTLANEARNRDFSRRRIGVNNTRDAIEWGGRNYP